MFIRDCEEATLGLGVFFVFLRGIFNLVLGSQDAGLGGVLARLSIFVAAGCVVTRAAF